jgi:hypothetical protein
VQESDLEVLSGKRGSRLRFPENGIHCLEHSITTGRHIPPFSRPEFPDQTNLMGLSGSVQQKSEGALISASHLPVLISELEMAILVDQSFVPVNSAIMAWTMLPTCLPLI